MSYWIIILKTIIISCFFTVKQARKGWNYATACYSKELKKQQSRGNEHENFPWVHYKSMSFLKESMSHKNDDTGNSQLQTGEESHSNFELVEPNIEREVTKDEENKSLNWLLQPVNSKAEEIFCEPPQEHSLKNITQMSKEPQEKLKKIIKYTGNKRLNGLEKNTMMDEDDDLLFLKSLLPQIKMLSLSKKMGIRFKFLEIILREIEDFERSNGINE